MDVLIKSNGEYERKTFGEVELVEWFKAHSTKEGDVTEEIVLFTNSEIKAANDGKIKWIMSDYSLDRDQERIDPAGWDLKNYKLNPIVLWAHNSQVPAIGKASDVRRLDGAIVGNIEFDNDDPLGALIERKVRGGYVTKGSVGFMSKKVEIIESDDKEPARLIHRKQELYEFSIVNIPSNPNAGVQLDAEPDDEKVIEELAEAMSEVKETYINTIFKDRDETSPTEVVDETSLQYMFREDDEKITIEELLYGTT